MNSVEAVVCLFGLAFGAGATCWLTSRYDLRRLNFRSQRIPSIAGLVFVLAGMWIYAYEWLSNGFDPKPAAAFFIVTFGFGALGLLDDLGGDRSVGGFRGHFQSLLEGQVTTGAAKALGGGLVSLAAAYTIDWPHPGRTLLAALLIALSANTLNLLDLRPGRCLFGFLVGAALLMITLGVHHVLGVGFLLYVALAAAVLLYPWDALGLVMLGDTGANAFGAVLGLAAALYCTWEWQTVVVVLSIAFQFWSEKHSLSKMIEAQPILRSLDRKIGVR